MRSTIRSPRHEPRVWVAAAVALAAGVAVLLVGLPASRTLFGTPLADLTLPAALVVAAGGTALAAALLTPARWRVVDLVVASVLGVAGGLLFAVWNLTWPTISGLLSFYPPASALLVGVWLLPGVLGGLVIRKPGAAVYTELVAATLSAVIGNQWGFATVWYGLVQGLGAEVVLALLLYRRFGLGAAIGAGLGAGVAVGLLDSLIYFPAFSAAYVTVYVLLAMLSGAVIAGVGSWWLTRRLADTGVLAPLASGRVGERV